MDNTFLESFETVSFVATNNRHRKHRKEIQKRGDCISHRYPGRTTFSPASPRKTKRVTVVGENHALEKSFVEPGRNDEAFWRTRK